MYYFWILICLHFAASVVAGKVAKDTYLANKVSVLRTSGGRAEEFDIYFEWDDKSMGIPGAFYVKSFMNDEFFLVSVTLEYPSQTSEHDVNNIHFDCNSWVHNHKGYKTDRIFFANTVSEIMIFVISFLNLNDETIYL